jgi:hypothetical protein
VESVKLVSRTTWSSLRRSLLKRPLLGLVLVALGAGPALADDVPTKVFPLSGSLLKEPMLDAAEVLTKTLARSLGASVSRKPIEDEAGCDLRLDSCLDDVVKTAGVQRIVFGTVTSRLRGGVIVRLTWYDGQGEEQRRYVLTGDTTEELASQLEHRLAGHDNGSETEPGDEPPAKPSKPKAPPAPSPAGRTTTTIWVVLGGGIASTAVGGGLLLSTYSLRDQVKRAPTNTSADFAYLTQLEDAGRKRTWIGGALMAAGAALGAYDMYRYVDERDQHPAVDVVPEKGGASVLVTLPWR